MLRQFLREELRKKEELLVQLAVQKTDKSAERRTALEDEIKDIGRLLALF